VNGEVRLRIRIRRMRLAVPVLLAAVLGSACSAEPSASPVIKDAGTDAKRKVDAGPKDAGPDSFDPRLDRMTSGGGKVLASMKLGIIYIGIDETEGSPSQDAYITWLVSSGWWGIMKQYGVDPGSVVGSVRVPRADFVKASDIDSKGRVSYGFVSWQVDQLIGTGQDAGGALVPGADSYIVFLPWGVNVDLGIGVTCAEIGGYHSTTPSNVPYSLMPPCEIGHSGTAISHELAEMATDPFPYGGWADHTMQQGEIGDLCNAASLWDGHIVTRLWSNEAGDCIPE